MADHVEIDQVRNNKGSYSFLNVKLVKLQLLPYSGFRLERAHHCSHLYYLPIDNTAHLDGTKESISNQPMDIRL